MAIVTCNLLTTEVQVKTDNEVPIEDIMLDLIGWTYYTKFQSHSFENNEIKNTGH